MMVAAQAKCDSESVVTHTSMSAITAIETWDVIIHFRLLNTCSNNAPHRNLPIHGNTKIDVSRVF